jgi:Flp pilus assembly protein TadG
MNINERNSRAARHLIAEDSGQALVETTLFLVLICLLIAFTINVNHFIGFVQTVHTASSKGATLSIQGQLSTSGSLPAGSQVSLAAINETANTTRNLNEAAPTVNVCSASIGTIGGATECSAGGVSGFVDPESGTSSTAGTFYANSVEVNQTFTPIFSGTIMGHAVMPLSAPQFYSHTVYMRGLN